VSNTVASSVATEPWTETTLGELTEYITSGSRDWSRYYADSGAIFIRTQDINQNRLSLEEVAFVKLPEKVEGKRSLVRKGDLLVTITGANVGKVAVVEGEIPEAYVSQSVCLVRLKDPSLAKFVHLQLTAKRGDKTTVEAMAYGLGRPVLNLENIRSAPIRVAPAKVLLAIVEEIEKQFSCLDEAVANLKHVKANFKRYKAAVLKAAVEGKLTEEWRKQHPDFEPASKLLERILAERRAKWSGKGKFEEPIGLETTVLPKLPDGWSWTSLDHLLREPLRNGHSAKASGTGHGLRAFTLSAVTEGDFSERNTKLTVAQADKVADLWAEPGDIYVERSNTPELVGLARLYKGPTRFAFIPDLLIRVRIITVVLAKFLEVCLLSEHVRQYFRSKAQGISGTMPKIDQSVIEKTPIPLPPVQEQGQIVAEVERRLSVIGELEVAVQANLTRADRLRQSILHQAFSGQLACLLRSMAPASLMRESRQTGLGTRLMT
jgi:type I restriction enzyme S subunit